MSRASQRIDGVAFEAWKLRHTGTVEITEEDADKLAIGEVVVTVSVSVVGDVQAKLDKEGSLSRVGVLKATETVVLDGELKGILVDRLGLYGSDTMPPPVRIIPGERTEAQRASIQGIEDVQYAYTINADTETGEIPFPQDVVDQERQEWESRQAALDDESPVDDEEEEFFGDAEVEVIGSIYDATKDAVPEPRSGSGPKVVPMRESEVQGAGGGQAVGRVSVKDPVLARALASDVGWS